MGENIPTHNHAFGTKGVGACENSRVCVLCRPEKEIVDFDYQQLSKQFTQKLNSKILPDTFDACITYMLTSEDRYRHKFTQKQLDFLQRNQSKLAKRVEGQIIKRIKRLTNRDGTQSPFRTHATDPMFHTLALCCRGCLSSWHQIMPNAVLSNSQVKRLTDFAMHYFNNHILNEASSPNEHQTVREFMTAEYSTDGSPRYDHSEVEIIASEPCFTVKKVGPGLQVTLRTKKPKKSKRKAKTHPKRKKKKQN